MAGVLRRMARVSGHRFVVSLPLGKCGGFGGLAPRLVAELGDKTCCQVLLVASRTAGSRRGTLRCLWASACHEASSSNVSFQALDYGWSLRPPASHRCAVSPPT